MRKVTYPCFILMGLVALGCKRKSDDVPPPPVASAAPAASPVAVNPEPAPAASVAAAPGASAAAPGASAAAPSAAKVPTQEDFEKKAKASVSNKSQAAQELSKLEKEIGQ